MSEIINGIIYLSGYPLKPTSKIRHSKRSRLILIALNSYPSIDLLNCDHIFTPKKEEFVRNAQVLKTAEEQGQMAT